MYSKVIFGVFTCALCVCFIKGDVAILKSDQAPEGHCYMKKDNILFEVGKAVTKVGGLCNKYVCSYPVINYSGCGVAQIQTPDGRTCRAAHDLSKKYPDCCLSNKCAD